MSAALDFRKCKRLLLSSLAVSPGTGVHVAKQRHGFCRAKSQLRNKKRNSLRCSFFGGDAGFALQRLLPKVNRVQPKGFTLQSNGTAFAVRNPRFGIKKGTAFAVPFFGGDAGI